MINNSDSLTPRVWGIRLGAKGFLAKPINKEELLGKVRSVIAVARRAQERDQVAAISTTDTLLR